jgi:hypothetical protein
MIFHEQTWGILGTCFMHSRAYTHTTMKYDLLCPRVKMYRNTALIALVLRFSRMEFNAQIRLSRMSCVECWKLSSVWIFTLKMAATVFSTTFDNFQHSTRLIPESRSYTLLLSLGLGSMSIPLCRCSLPVHKRTRREGEVKGLSRFFWSMITSRHHTKPFLRKLSRKPMPHNFTNILIINPQRLTLSVQPGLKPQTTHLRFLSASHHAPQCQCTKC